MSRALDKLIAVHKRNNNSRHTRLYSENNSELTTIEEQEKKLEESPKTIQVLDTDEQMVDKLLGLSLEDLSKVEEDLKQSNKEEKSSYRYRILPRIYSNIERISSSPQLERKLISYYLRHRRRDKMRRFYGKRNNYFSGKLADSLLHEMYMELGRTLYFSWLSDLRDWVKRKALDLPAVRHVIELRQYFVGKASEYMRQIKKHGLVEFFARLLGGGAGITTLVIMIAMGLLNYLRWHETGGGWWEDFITTAAYIVVVVAALIIVPFLVGVIVYFIAKLIISGVTLAVEFVRKLLRPKAMKVYLKAMKLLVATLPALSKLLSEKKMSVDSALEVLSNFLKGSEGDAEAMNKAISNIKQLAKAPIKFGNYITVNNERDLWKILTKESDYKLGFSIEIASFVKDKIGSTFKVGDTLESKSFDPSQYDNLEKILMSGEPNIGLPTGKDLPIELAILVVFTSPKIVLTIKSSSAESNIIFNAGDYFMNHSAIETEHIEEFLDSYLEAFAGSRGKLSEVFRKAYEEKEYE